jgi:hypothetical protein
VIIFGLLPASDPSRGTSFQFTEKLKSEPQNIESRMMNVEGKDKSFSRTENAQTAEKEKFVLNFMIRYSLFDIRHSISHLAAAIGPQHEKYTRWRSVARGEGGA